MVLFASVILSAFLINPSDVPVDSLKNKPVPAALMKIVEQVTKQSVKSNGDEIELEIVEGKFHQVKRMAEAVGNKVVFLKRIKFAGIELGDLKTGEVKEIEEKDITG